MALAFYACSDDSFEVWQTQQSPDDVAFNLNYSLQLQEPVTRSVVYGEDGADEKGVQTMQLLCFDANGQYLNIRSAELGALGFEGKITGTVPQGTARIHFVANRELGVALDLPTGTPEEEVMKSISTMYDHQAICYWGYRKFDTAAQMNDWLQGKNVTEENKIVYMIRDRAKIKLSMNSDPTKIIDGFEVTGVTWRIHNGHESGYIAPKSEEWESYFRQNTNGTTEESKQKIVSNASSNPNNSARYTIINDDALFEPSSTPQYLFDDLNRNDDQKKEVVKVILKVTYSNGKESDTKYFVTLVKAPNDTYIPIIRNYTYQLTVTSLDLDVSYDTLKDAIEGNKYANGDVEVSRSLTDISNEANSLQIKLPTETTSIVFNMATNAGETNNQMQFVIVKTSDLSDAGVDASAVNVYWEGGISRGTTEGGITEYVTLQDPIVTKDGGLFTIPVTVSTPPSDLKNDWLVVQYTDTQNRTLTRYIRVYVINQFQFLTAPTLTKESNGDYKLSFQIPPLEATNLGDPMYPEGLYPINVMFTTSTLKAWSLDGSAAAYGSFGTSVESTSNFTDIGTGLEYNLFDASGFESDAYTQVSSTNSDDVAYWWYQPTTYWDYWYTYSIRQYPADGLVNIYFKDVTGNLNYTSTHSNVGLYMYIRYFGKIYAMTVSRS